jgi:hypothetical protein
MGYCPEAVCEYIMTLLNSNYEEWHMQNADKPYTSFPFNIKKMSISGCLFDFAKLNDVSKNVISKMTAEQVLAEYEHNRTFYKNGSLKIKPAAARLTVNKKERTVTVSSDEYIHAIELSSDAIFSDNCFSLLPGEERTVSYTENTDGDIKLTAYTLEF